jgi:hypothetical protein
MDKLTEPSFWRRLFTLRPPGPRSPIAPGIYHAMREHDGQPIRYHLRVEPDGSGMLLANATAGARLSASGTLMAKGILDGASDATILRDIDLAFSGAPQDTVQRDLKRMHALFTRLVDPGDTYPIITYEDTAFSPYEARLIAPLQATLPLAEPAQMNKLLGRLWEVGVPHVTLLAPLDGAAAPLVQAVERAEDLGMIAGVRGMGSRLHSTELLRDLALAGVDYIMLPYASADAATHDDLYGTDDHAATTRAFATIQEYEVCPVAEVPLVAATVKMFDATLDTLHSHGVEQASLFAIAVARGSAPDQHSGALSAAALRQLASTIAETSYQRTVRTTWQPPMLRDPATPLGQQLQHGPRCMGDVAVRIEPDGAVIPASGAHQSAGNLLRDPWQRIWQHPAFRIYRERVPRPTDESGLPDLTSGAADERSA